MAKKRMKSGGYHGVQGMAFVPKAGDEYPMDGKIEMKFAKNLKLTPVLEAVEQYADNMLLFRVPRDDGYEGELGSTAPDYELEKAAGYAMEGADGLIRTNMPYYTRGALYYEFKETDISGRDSVTKVWLYNVELGKGEESFESDTKSLSFGEYKYPIRVYGDKVMASDGTKVYLDERGLDRTTAMKLCRPEDASYTAFGDEVPVPKVAATPPPAPANLKMAKA